MASTSTRQAPLTSSSSTRLQKYEVFLGFRGADIPCDFKDYLSAALRKLGIIVFRDDKEQKPGEEIHPDLKDVIKTSQYAIVVISEKLAESKLCLSELTVVMECRRMGCLTVFPVFYGVDPDDVLIQRGNFGKYFAKLIDDPEVDIGKWKSWRCILREIGDCSLNPSKADEDQQESEWLFSRYHLKRALKKENNLYGWHVKDRYELKIVEEISLEIHERLIRNSRGIDEPVFGLELPVKEIINLLDLESDDVRCLWIWGVAGIGKTTLAEVIYERLSSQFEVRCFIHRIGENGDCSVDLLEQLISAMLDKPLTSDLLPEEPAVSGRTASLSRVSRMFHGKQSTKKVLIVLDGVCHQKQLHSLVPSCFGRGSRIIATSRDLCSPSFWKETRLDTYEVTELNHNYASQLLCSKAYGKRHPPVLLEEWINRIVGFMGGLPLLLEVCGSYLYNAEKNSIKLFGSYLYNAGESPPESFLIQLRVNGVAKVVDINAHARVVDVLKIHFSGLNDVLQEAFLDIVCFFGGQSKSCVASKLSSLGYSSEKILRDLKHNSLIKFGKNGELIIHDLLAQMGHQTAKQNTKQSRLFCFEDIVTVLSEIDVPNAIRGILLRFPLRRHESLCYDAFSLMKKLQLLEIDIPEEPIWSDSKREFIELEWWGSPLNFSLSNELVFLRWDQYPLEFLPSSFQPANLVELILRESSIKTLWADIKECPKLKYIDLNSSKELTEIPNLRKIPNLERLDLSYCSKLSSVHRSIGLLQQLTELSLRNCFHLERLPCTFCLPSLTSLDLCGCSRLQKFPGGVHNLTSLRTVNLNDTAIEILPTSFTKLSSLQYLYISGRLFAEDMTYDFSDSIKPLHPRDGPSGLLTDANFVNKRYRPKTLWTDARCVNICEWSSGLSSLEKLDLSYRSLEREALPSHFSFLSSLTYLNLSGNKFKEIPDSVHKLSKLRHLFLNNCINLDSLPRLPLGLRDLDLGNCPSLEKFYIDFNAGPSDKKSKPCDWMAAYFGDNG